MDALFSIGGVVVILLVTGLTLGAANRGKFNLRWLFVAAALLLVNDALLTGLYGTLPDLFPGARWNWQGKIAALIATLAIAALPVLGWRAAGITLKQNPGSLRSALPVAAIYMLFFVVVAVVFPSDAASFETIAFQLSMPGLEEELFYRGLLLLALDRAFLGRARFLGVDWGWGALMSCGLFGLAHSFGYSQGAFQFEPVIMALTSIPALLAVWLRLRTGSLLLPILLHNAGNSASFLV